MHDWLIFAATAAIGVAGYMAKRWLENHRINEALSRKLKVLEIFRGLKRAGLNSADLEKIEQELASARPPSRATIPDSRLPSTTRGE